MATNSIPSSLRQEVRDMFHLGDILLACSAADAAAKASSVRSYFTCGEIALSENSRWADTEPYAWLSEALAKLAGARPETRADWDNLARWLMEGARRFL